MNISVEKRVWALTAEVISGKNVTPHALPHAEFIAKPI
jgi:hypothetical protein